MIHHKLRWVFGPIDEATHEPVAKDYAVQWEAPMHHKGFALCLCLMNAHQLASARQDARLHVFGSLHEESEIPQHIARHHAEHGAKEGMRLHELLLALAKFHHGFEPEY